MDAHQVTRYRELIRDAANTVEIADILASLQAKYGEAVSRLDSTRANADATTPATPARKVFKRPGQRHMHQDARASGLGALAARFGVDVARFATALENALPNSYNPDTDPEMPLDAAKAFTSLSFPTPEIALEGIYISDIGLCLGFVQVRDR